MADLVGGLGTSHVPIIGRTIAAKKQAEVHFSPFFEAFGPVRQWAENAKPDVAIMIYNDHGLNFFLDNMPTFALGVAASYRNGDEGWGVDTLREFKGDAELAWHIANSLIEDEFDISTCGEMVLDHAGITALDLIWDDEADMPDKIIPIVINAVEPPFPKPIRCYRFGEALGRAIRSFAKDRKVLVIGSGGLSHELGEFGKINEEFDRHCLATIAAQPSELARYSSDEIVDIAGSQGIELMAWLAMRGALGESAAQEITSIYHNPISHTGGAMMLMEPAPSE